MKKPLTFKSLGLLFILILGVSACSPVKPVAETGMAAAILGSWQGTVEGEGETITFLEDGTYKALVRPEGFISNTLSEGVTGSISGTWTLDGQTITLQITGSEDEQVLNSTTTSTILSFSENELVLKSDGGETSTFTRVIPL